MQSRITSKLFQSAVQPTKTSSPKPQSSNQSQQSQQSSQSSQSTQTQSSQSSTSSSQLSQKSPNILSQSTPSVSNQNQPETFEHILIKNKNRIEKSRHIEGVVYQSNHSILDY